MRQVEESVLRYIAEEGFSSLAEIEAFIRLQPELSAEDANVTAIQLLTEWEDRGWADTAEMDPGGLISLTDKAFADLPWLPRQP